MSGFAEGTPTVTIQLGGKDYELAWTWGAKRRVKELLKAEEEFAENIATVLWASMDKESRGVLSVEDVEEMIHPANEAQVVGKFSELFVKSEPKEEPGKNVQPTAVKEPTVGNSSLKKSVQSESTISV